jgi:hypothetical protein
MVLIQLLLPATAPAGTNVMTPLAQTRRELAENFSGVTAYVRSLAKGLWTAPDGHTEADDVVMVEVVRRRSTVAGGAPMPRRWLNASAKKQFMSGEPGSAPKVKK